MLRRRGALGKDTVQECVGTVPSSISDRLGGRAGAGSKSRRKASTVQCLDPAGQVERWAPA